MTRHLPPIGRRGLLLGLAAGASLGGARLALAAPGGIAPTAPGGGIVPVAPGDARLVVVLLRGAMDGLFAVQPYADPALAALRGPLALPEPGREGGLLDLGGRFGLHPALAGLHGMFTAGTLAVVHACAGPYRTRSHFDAQDLLESGAAGRLSSGWLNRALLDLPAPAHGARPGLAAGPDMPLLLRGPAPVGMYAPARGSRPDADLYARLLALNHDDPLLGPAVAEGLRARLRRRGGRRRGGQRLRHPGRRRRTAAGHPRRPARGGAGDRRLGHPRRPGCAHRRTPGAARRRAGGAA